MGVLSVLRQSSARIITARFFNTCMKNNGDHHHPRLMEITPSRWQWHKFKDMLHFYVMLGAIPLGLLTLYVNIFIGPATLVPIPEGYIPQDHEYERHPVTRWIAKYILPSYQELYERKLHVLYIEDDMAQMRLLETKIKKLIREKEDVQAYTFRPVLTKYHKAIREDTESRSRIFGDFK